MAAQNKPEERIFTQIKEQMQDIQITRKESRVSDSFTGDGAMIKRESVIEHPVGLISILK